jgi:membrane protein YfhO
MGVRPLRHVLAVTAGYSLLFTWLFSRPIAHGTYMVEGALYDRLLPIFLSPITAWSHDMFGGLPLFADTSDSQAYVVHVLFAHVLHSWTGYIISAYVLGSAFTYAYVFALTRSKAAAAFAGMAFGLSHAMLEKQAQINIVHCTAWFPLMALAVDRAITDSPAARRWVAIGAFATANCFLAGHPQSILYAVSFCAVYAAAGGIAERAPREAWVRLATMLALGVALTAIKSLPFVEASRFMARQDVTYQGFISPAPSGSQVVSGLLNPPLHDPSKPVSLYVGLAVLVLAAAGACSRRLSWRARIWAAAAVFSVLVVAGDATPVAWLAYHVPLWNQFRIISRILFIYACATAVLSGFALAAIQRRLTRPALFAATAMGLGAITAVDLLAHVQYPVGPGGFRLVELPRGDTAPSVHARALADAVAPAHQRLLAAGGASRDDTLPAGFARLWRIPTAGGYSPIMSARLAAMAGMGSPGDVHPEVLASEDRSLDLLAVRDIIVHENEYPADGAPLDFAIGRPDCSPPYERTAAFQLPADVDVASVALVAHLRCADDVAHGATVAHVEFRTADGDVYARPLLSAVDVAYQGQTNPVTVRIDLPPSKYVDMRVRVVPMRGWLTLDGVTLMDSSGHSWPQSLGGLLLANSDRWRQVAAYRTSRYTDRDRDQDVPGEASYRVYENQRALPRAWMVSSVVEQDDEQAINTIRYSQFPDGRPFDPRSTAIVPPGSGARSYPEGAEEPRLTSLEDTRLTIDVTSDGGGYLVLSEAHYPGWRAAIDGRPADVQRVDVMFQGVAVPPGHHTVAFALASTTLRAGIAISVLAAGVVLFLLVVPASAAARGSTAAFRSLRTAGASPRLVSALRSRAASSGARTR